MNNNSDAPRIEDDEMALSSSGIDEAVSTKKVWVWLVALFFSLVVCGVSIFGVYEFSQRNLKDEIVSFELGRVNRSVNEFTKSGKKEEILAFVNGRDGYQRFEDDVRAIDSKLAMELGLAWSEVRRRGLVADVDRTSLSDVLIVAERVRGKVDDLARFHQDLARLSLIFCGIGLLFAGICGAILFSSREHNIVIQKVLSRGSLNSEENEDIGTKKLSHSSRMILETFPEAVARFESDGAVLMWNQAMATLFGVSQDDAMGANISDLLGWTAAGDLGRGAISKLVSGESIDELEWEYKHPNDEVLSLLAKVNPEYDLADNVLGGVVVVRDVTNSRRLRKALMQSETEKSAILRAMKDTIVQVDHEGNLVALHDNNQFFDIVANRVGSKCWQDDMPDDLRYAVSEILRESLLKPGSFQFEFSGKWNGSHRQILVRASAYGRSESLLTFEDVSIRKTAEEAISLGEAKFRSLVEGSADMILTVDPDGRVLYASPAVEEVLGYSSEEMVGKSWQSFIAEEDRDWLDKAGRRWQDSDQQIGRLIVKHQRKDGVCLETEVAARNMLNVSPIFALVLNIRDVSARRALERELANTKQITKQVSDELASASRTDLVTGLLNFQAFWTYADAGCEYAKDGGVVSCAIFDIKGFSEMNRKYGAGMADAYLKVLAYELQSRFELPNMVARLSGGEFGVIMPMIDRERAGEICSWVVPPSLNVDGTQICASITFGVSSASDIEMSPGELVGLAMSEVDLKRRGNQDSAA